MLISVVTPTFDRDDFLPALYRCVCAQTHADLEWLVLDDSPRPSSFMSGLTDPRVRYHHVTDRMTIGQKRNWLGSHCRGEIIAHFDDDDYYAPRFLATMAAELGTADLVKLAGFFILNLGSGLFAYWDTRRMERVHWRLNANDAPEINLSAALSDVQLASFMRRNLLGYGFSYVYRAESWRRRPFSESNHGEDVEFAMGLEDAGMSVRLVDDDRGLAIAVRHSRCQSVLFPQYLLPPGLLRLIFPEAPAVLALSSESRSVRPDQQAP